jgi:hypothetical protein
MSDAEPKPADLWAESQEGDVAAVNPADLKNVWAMFRDVQARAGAEHRCIDVRSYQHACSPGADVTAVWFRASMLGVLQMFPESPLMQWTHDGEFDDVVFQVAATFPMKKMQVGVVHEGPPFDVEDFVEQLAAK